MIDPNIAVMNALGLGDLKPATRVEVVLEPCKEPSVSIIMRHPQTWDPYEKRGTLYLKPDGSLGFDPS